MADKTIVFEVIGKSFTQGVAIDSEGLPVTVQITSVTFIPLNEGLAGDSVTGSFNLNTDDPDSYALGEKYDATFVAHIDAPEPSVV